jgi:hypothetical protein
MPIQLGFTGFPKCPKCKIEAEMVPVYRNMTMAASGVAQGANESLEWKCVNCGNTIQLT